MTQFTLNVPKHSREVEFKGRNIQYPNKFERIQLPRSGMAPRFPKPTHHIPKAHLTTPLSWFAVLYACKIKLFAFLPGETESFLSFRQLVLVIYLWRAGFVNYVVWTQLEPFEPQIYYYHVNSPFFSQLTDGARPRLSSLSRGFSYEQSQVFVKSIGECLERVPFLYYQNRQLISGTYQECSQDMVAVDPSACDVLTPQQRKLLELEISGPDTVYRWEQVEQLAVEQGSVVKKAAIAPAQLVYRWYDCASTEALLAEQNTNGYAAGPTAEAAMTGALLEYIERDAFFAHWLLGVVPDQFAHDSLQDVAAQHMLADLKNRGFQVYILDVTMPDTAVPAMFTVVMHPELGMTAGGAGCDFFLEKAIRKSLQEATSMVHWISIHQLYEDRYESYPYRDTNYGDDKRLGFWQRREAQGLLQPWLAGVERAVAEYTHLNLRTGHDLVAHLNSIGMDVYQYQYPHPVLREIQVHSCRCIIPDLIPMYHYMHTAPLSHKRLTTAKDLLHDTGKRTLLNDTPYWNYPHLFP